MSHERSFKLLGGSRIWTTLSMIYDVLFITSKSMTQYRLIEYGKKVTQPSKFIDIILPYAVYRSLNNGARRYYGFKMPICRPQLYFCLRKAKE